MPAMPPATAPTPLATVPTVLPIADPTLLAIGPSSILEALNSLKRIVQFQLIYMLMLFIL